MEGSINQADTKAARTSGSRAPPAFMATWNMRLVALAAIGVLVLLALAATFFFLTGRYATTDNAYVKSDKISISADIAGRVARVFVKENQRVSEGDLLFRLDQEPFRITLAKAEASLAMAQQDVAALRAQYQQRAASLKLAEGNLVFFQQQFDRQKKLAQKRVVSQTGIDTAAKNLRNAQDQVNLARQNLAEVRAKLGGDDKIATEAHPAVRVAQALANEAALNLRRTEVRAPVSGVVTNFDLQVGEYIKAGSVAFSLVGAGNAWVEANFRETSLTHVRVGQSATITVDAYPGVKYQAIVASISPATGAEFALLPAQNSTGNWVKVVQRLTVKLTLQNPKTEPRLRAGMSVIVRIDTGRRRSLFGLGSTLY